MLEEISGLTREEAEGGSFSDLESELEDRLGRMVRDQTWRPRSGPMAKRGS